MKNSEGLITPVKTEIFPDSDGEMILTKVSFPDGSYSAEVDFGTDKYFVMSSPEGVIPKPDKGRYPYTERLAELAVEHFNETGTLPF